MKDRFLRAARCETVDTTPVWFMRQAGRSLPEYRAIREKYSLLDITRTPELCAEVTLQPVRRHKVDAAIVFADIALPLMVMGADVDLVDGVGPVAQHPVRTEDDVARLHVPDPVEALPHLYSALRILRDELDGVPLVGFAGAPFTLAAYAIEGKPARDFHTARAFMYSAPRAWNLLMGKLTDFTIAYLQAQVRAGAQALQLFDTWVGVLSAKEYQHHVGPFVERIFSSLAALDVPLIHFGTANAHLLQLMNHPRVDVVGIDHRIPIGQVFDQPDRNFAVQGNLDPAVLLAPPAICLAHAKDILDTVDGRRGHIFNLGHGVLPDTSADLLTRVTEFVHEYSLRPTAVTVGERSV